MRLLDKSLTESIYMALNEEEEKKFRISWGYNRNEHTGDYEESGEFDVMAKDEEEAERKARRELDRTPCDDIWIQSVSDAEVFGIEYLGQRYKANGLPTDRDPEIERVFVAGSEEEVKKFSRDLIGKFIETRYEDKLSGAYKCTRVREVYIAAVPKTERTPEASDPDVFKKLQGEFVPRDTKHQKEVQEKILKLFKEKIKEEHYKGRVSFEMDDEKVDSPGYIGTICIYAWNFGGSDKTTLEEICDSCGCKAERDRNYEAMTYLCYAIYEKDSSIKEGTIYKYDRDKGYGYFTSDGKEEKPKEEPKKEVGRADYPNDEDLMASLNDGDTAELDYGYKLKKYNDCYQIYSVHPYDETDYSFAKSKDGIKWVVVDPEKRTLDMQHVVEPQKRYEIEINPSNPAVDENDLTSVINKMREIDSTKTSRIDRS